MDSSMYTCRVIHFASPELLIARSRPSRSRHSFHSQHSLLLHATLLSSTLLSFTHNTLFYSTLLFFPPRYSSLLSATLLYSLLLSFTLCYSPLLSATLLSSTLLSFTLYYSVSDTHHTVAAVSLTMKSYCWCLLLSILFEFYVSFHYLTFFWGAGSPLQEEIFLLERNGHSGSCVFPDGGGKQNK